MAERKRNASFAIGTVMVAVLTAHTMPARADVQADPNIPGPLSPPGLRIQWSQPVPGYPEVILADPEGPRSSQRVQYLGWNDQGSYFRNYDDRQVYVWNLNKNSLTKIGPDIPPDVVATLKNNHYAVAKSATPPPPKAKAPEPKSPDTSRQAAFFGGSGNLPQAGDAGAITGTGVAIEGGVLTFTRPDRSQATYRVTRPKLISISPQSASAGTVGTWIAMEDGGKGILFTVQPDHSVTGREVPAQVIQMLQRAPQ